MTNKCKHCKNPASAKFGLNYFCDTECAYNHARAIQAKKASKESSERRKRDRERLAQLKSRSEWLKDLQVVFNKYIRIRDAKENCISCERPLGAKFDAGHYKSVGAHPELRFSEVNTHGQCVFCNQHLSGNLINYRIGLIKRIGLEEVEKLESKHEPLKLTVVEIKELIKTYKAKVKELTAPTGEIF